MSSGYLCTSANGLYSNYCRRKAVYIVSSPGRGSFLEQLNQGKFLCLLHAREEFRVECEVIQPGEQVNIFKVELFATHVGKEKE